LKSVSGRQIDCLIPVIHRSPLLAQSAGLRIGASDDKAAIQVFESTALKPILTIICQHYFRPTVCRESTNIQSHTGKMQTAMIKVALEESIAIGTQHLMQF
jgi:hypothetical protein